MEINKKEFDRYTSEFDMNDPKIDLKYYHTYRVVEYCTKLAKSLNLDEHDTFLAETTGLLHDIARFPQARDYNTFNDFISFDHGKKAVEILLENNYIYEYVDNEEDKNLVLKAVELHNDKYIQEELSEREELFCKIIRDADKLDIMDKQGMKLEDNSTHFQEDAFNELKNKTLITYTYCNNHATNILKTLAYIFDVNFKESFKIMVEQNMIEKKLKLLKEHVVKEEYEIVEKIINDYVEERLNEE
ncbi:MAG: HD domain-containing protein [Bacilli bacterium]|nr:HD domain-containing protein [Bacilli bacterium]